MQPFEHCDVKRFGDVARLVGPRDVLIAGGTDLLPLMRDGLATPRTVVNLKTIRGGDAITVGRRGAAFGALALVADIAAHPGVRRAYPALAEACRVVGSQQIRNMATLGGNLCQRIRCWYFRQHVSCHKTGGRGCPAVDGLNEYLAIFGDGPCHAPHPSDPAVALAALDARVSVRVAGPRRTPGGIRRLTLKQLYARAASRQDSETILDSGDVIEKITIPARFAGARQVYLKTAQREMFDFALVSVAVVWPRGRNVAPRVALGGVAPAPLEVEIREPGSGRRWAERVAGAAVAQARPLSQNGYKVEIARNLLATALLRPTGSRSPTV